MKSKIMDKQCNIFIHNVTIYQIYVYVSNFLFIAPTQYRIVQPSFNNSSQDSSLGKDDLANLEKSSRPAATSAATKFEMRTTSVKRSSAHYISLPCKHAITCRYQACSRPMLTASDQYRLVTGTYRHVYGVCSRSIQFVMVVGQANRSFLLAQKHFAASAKR